MSRRTLIPLLAATLLAAGAGAADFRPDLDHMKWDRYYSHEEMVAILHAMNAAHPDLTDLATLGKSEEGRDVWCLTITNEKTGPASSKPAVYADGAIHGNEIQATEVCLYLAWQLLDKYGKWDKITDLVDTRAFYIVPTINVDGRARFFDDAGNYNLGRSARVPYDDDHDGLVDEDGPEDLDGDGMILQMRVRDPHGGFKTDPEDPRVMVRVKPGEQGEWRRLGLEGTDDDGDGRVNEDPPGYLDMNRNWGFLWQPTYVQSGAGLYPFSAKVTRAVSEFLRGTSNICFGFNFHNYGGMFLRGPGSDLTPPLPPGDKKLYDYLGEEGERVVPGYRYLVAKDDLYTTHGDFDEWLYQCLGVYAFVTELSMTSDEAFRGHGDDPNGPDGELWSRHPSQDELQKFNDALMAGEMFSDWKPFHHPTYGDIEIGGWRTFTTRMPPTFLLPQLVHRNAMYVIWTATQTPQVTVEVFETKDLGGGLTRVRARATNAGAMPTLSEKVRGKRILPLDRFRIEGDGIAVHSGGVLLDHDFGKVAPVAHDPETVPTWIGGFGVREAQWIVSGKGDAKVVYAGAKCGSHAAELKLP